MDSRWLLSTSVSRRAPRALPSHASSSRSQSADSSSSTGAKVFERASEPSDRDPHLVDGLDFAESHADVPGDELEDEIVPAL